ncbi:MAG: chromosome segregation protein SMC [Chloroflexi bacterium]|nr:chromosome segregation protein SMC [Chloroflexota bacterium]
MTRLKSLELHGYKTFASKTHFEFAEGITTIVGPNGSGKSNIADAIRWVLGEQSYSLLRGKKTEDMIFAGSEQRPRAGMASATITFDNGDGGLPIDYTEVAIARHAYRDGGNEYLLNDQHVRLKDIEELLAQTGLAERTYTVIGQGLVDVALALKPEERRRLFEEAAGIGLYRARREDALRRLEATQHNLERVQDILAELQPRVRSLERQAKRASEFDTIRQELKDVLRVWYGFHWHRSQAEMAQAHVQAQAAAKTLDDLRSQQEVSDTSLIDLRAKLAALRAQLNAWHRQAAQLHQERETHGRSLAASEEHARSLERSREETQALLSTAEADVAALEQRARLGQEDMVRFQVEAADLQQQLSAAEATRAARETERRERAAKAEAQRQHVLDLEAGSARQSAALGELNDRLQRLAATAEATRSEQGQVEKNIEHAAAQREAVHAAQRQASERLAEARRALQALVSELEGQRVALAAARERTAARVSAEEQLAARAAGLAHDEREGLGYSSGVRTVMAAGQRGLVQGRLQALGAVLEIPAEYEVAVTAALGDLFDAILVDDAAAVDTLLEVLGQRDSGRAALLPLGDLTPLEPLAVPAGEDVIGLAARHVSGPPAYRPAIDVLLGQTVLVRSRGAARRVARSLPPHARAVTLAGEVFHPAGAVVAGRGEPPSSLTRARERREIEARTRAAHGQREQAQAEVAAAEARLAELTAGETAQRGELARLEQAEAAARQAAEAARATLAQLEAEREWKARRSGEANDELERARAAHAEAERAVETLRGQVEHEKSLLTSGALRLEDTVRVDLGEDPAQWSTRLALIEHSGREAQSRVADSQSMLSRARQALAERRARLRAVDEERQTLERSLADLREREGQLSKTIDETQALITPAETQLDANEADLNRLEQTEAEVRSHLHSSEHAYTQAQVDLARRQEELEGLRRRIEDDFGLVEFEYASEVTGPTPLPISELVQKLPHVEELPGEVEDLVTRRRAQMRRMGAVNPEAPQEYREVKERYEFLTEQVADLLQAQTQLRQVIGELDQMMQDSFRKTFDAVAIEFPKTFSQLFGGGSAKLQLTDPDNLNETGIEIQARLPGRRAQPLALLSGGERSLTAVALVFALLRVAPTPFCVLDEVDAMLDESNVGRFRDMLAELSRNTQFVVITHNRNTVQASQVIYGISMGPDSASQVISLRLDEFVAR